MKCIEMNVKVKRHSFDVLASLAYVLCQSLTIAAVMVGGVSSVHCPPCYDLIVTRLRDVGAEPGAVIYSAV